MQLFSWLHKRMTGRPQTRSTPAPKPVLRFRPQFEPLERRDLPSFSAPVVYSAPQTVALITGDINGDGKPDLISIQSGQGIAVQLNNGNGTFGAAIITSDNEAQLGPATALAVGPYMGKPSIWVSHEQTVDSRDDADFSILQFTQPTKPTGYDTLTDVGDWIPLPPDEIGGHISSLALADLYGDGETDLVATDGQAVYVARSNSGSFGPVQFYNIWQPTTAPARAQVAVGDLNGDGKPDIVVTNPTLNAVSVFMNNGNGAFWAAQTYAVGASPTAVAAGDVSGDGKLYVVTANASGTVSVLAGQGNGAFGTAQTYAISGPGNSIAVGDFNHDGFLDVVTTGTEMDLLLNNGNGTFGTYQPVGPAGSNVVADNFVSPGFFDLAQIDASHNSIDVLLNNADPPPPPAQVSLSFGRITYNRNRQLYSETVTLTNITSGPLTGPLSLKLTNLPSGVALTDATGVTYGFPYIRFLSSGKTLKKGASVSITLTFAAPSLSDITFGTEVVVL
jgi:hypothetical protein